MPMMNIFIVIEFPYIFKFYFILRIPDFLLGGLPHVPNLFDYLTCFYVAILKKSSRDFTV